MDQVKLRILCIKEWDSFFWISRRAPPGTCEVKNSFWAVVGRLDTSPSPWKCRAVLPLQPPHPFEMCKYPCQDTLTWKWPTCSHFSTHLSPLNLAFWFGLIFFLLAYLVWLLTLSPPWLLGLAPFSQLSAPLFPLSGPHFHFFSFLRLSLWQSPIHRAISIEKVEKLGEHCILFPQSCPLPRLCHLLRQPLSPPAFAVPRGHQGRLSHDSMHHFWEMWSCQVIQKPRLSIYYLKGHSTIPRTPQQAICQTKTLLL